MLLVCCFLYRNVSCVLVFAMLVMSTLCTRINMLKLSVCICVFNVAHMSGLITVLHLVLCIVCQLHSFRN